MVYGKSKEKKKNCVLLFKTFTTTIIRNSCLGSTQHLKNLYGAGYTLEMKLRGGDRTPTSGSSDRVSELKEFVAGLFPDASLQESFADRLMFSVPQQSVPSLANCFTQLEKGIHLLVLHSPQLKK